MTGIVNKIGASSGNIGSITKDAMTEDVIGGTKRTYSGYESRTFLGSGSIYFPQDKTVDWFLVGGGGSGGDAYTTNGNGGGGGGGVVTAVGYAISAGSYNISIGPGGSVRDGSRPNTDASSGSARGHRGEPSRFGDFVAHGGGGGGSTWLRQGNPPGAEGGCAGGQGSQATYYNNTTTQNTYGSTPNVTGYGYTGGPGSNWGGGGGGGAGGSGTAGTDTVHGHGGVGRTCLYETGSNKYFAGGGGGGGNSSEPSGAGKYGGGRGHGHCQFNGNTDYNNGSYEDSKGGASGWTNPYQGSAHLDAFPNQGGGGGAGSYWSRWPQTGWQGEAGRGGSGYFVIRWAV